MSKVLLTLAALALTACASKPAFLESKAEQALSQGISAYEVGSYTEATKSLQSALAQGLNSKDQVRAYKYLAFTDCVTGKERACRENFKKALDINPAMELTPAEVGHPIWGPVFQSAKGKKSDAKK